MLARRLPTNAPWLPAVCAAILLALSTTPRVGVGSVLQSSFWMAAGMLVAWLGVLAWVGRSRGKPFAVEVAVRPHHWVQALVQLSVFVYWGWYWRPVYDMAVLLAAQIVFAYAVGALLAWSRGGRYRLGFGPFPIIFSINLFLWFRDDWFYLQFLMIVVGFLGKELVRWQRSGKQVHIFNPSAFALGLFSLVLIATGTTDLTWGREIASTLTLAPGIYTYLFGVGLVVMYFFSITLIAGTAAAVLFGLSAAWWAWTGVPYFVDSEIPAAVFLGLHLLVTDPSTSPRTAPGKAVFGGLYGAGVFALYAVLGAAGVPTFYDKLLCVPLLNLAVRAIDRAVRRVGSGRPLGEAAAGARRGPPRSAWARPATTAASSGRPASTTWWRPRPVNLAHMAGWIVFFAAMSATGRTDGMHRGDRVPFWEEACAEGRAGACDRLLQIESTYCGDNAAWACNELGVHHGSGRFTEVDPEVATGYFARACELRLQAGCANLLARSDPLRPDPRPLDLRLLLREGGLNLMEMPEPRLLERACTHGWAFACRTTAAST